jgi:chromate transporter
MSDPAAIGVLSGHLALLSSISFGGIPSVLPDIRNFVVTAHGWLTDREFANCFAVAQAIPGPNMILMMSYIGWKVAGFPGAIASAFATFGPPCTMYYSGYRLWDRFREARWQRITRAGIAPLTIGLIIAGGTVMARTADANWQSAAVTGAAAGLLLATRVNPLWMIAAAGMLGGLGFL